MRHALIAACALAIGASAAKGAVLYNQPFDGLGNPTASQNDTNGFGNFATVYDNFLLGSSATITSVDWTGSYYNPASQSAITAFTISFYADSGGPTGSALYTTSVSGTANETFLGNYAGFPTYTYDLPVNFTAAAGTTYWMSVVPDLGFPPQWGWEGGTGGDGVSYQDFFGNRSALPADAAFTLNGAGGAPEPAAWAMMILGAFGTGALLRRRRAQELALVRVRIAS
ncbi:MAG TPA: PEP-CTERM sorting domain-containing protein [Caulobacteraceae bacterium]|jgi:hypothetical protein|nr:PEP-CTERM sorting domain-containing protein [Caulobacteraceae bacterium]